MVQHSTGERPLMTPSEFTVAEKAKHHRKKPPAAWIFFQRWMANPVSMGSITPSSIGLQKLIQKHVVCGPDQVVVEFGGGTGAITKALLNSGLSGDRIYSFEIDHHLADYLQGVYPDVNVINDDCRKAAELIGPDLVGKVGTVVIGIPLSMLSLDMQREIVEASFSIMPSGSRFILYTYFLTSPINMQALGLHGKRLGWTPRNIPPASVWGYTKP
jgi:phosphatidylethanolamine/phosphatidyl-N-methylethanolamine N-methyltransferase